MARFAGHDAFPLEVLEVAQRLLQEAGCVLLRQLLSVDRRRQLERCPWLAVERREQRIEALADESPRAIDVTVHVDEWAAVSRQAEPGSDAIQRAG